MNIAEILKELRERAELSRDKLAKRAGYERGTSLARYEDPDYMKGRKLPADVVARLATALDGLGQPPIVRSEVWALAEPGAAIVISAIAVMSIPVLPWEKLVPGVAALKSLPRLDSVEVAGAEPRDLMSARVEDDHAERVAARGSTVVFDASDTELRDGRRYIIIIDGQKILRRYQTNPERWESESAAPSAAIYPREAVQVIGRVVRTIKEW